METNQPTISSTPNTGATTSKKLSKILIVFLAISLVISVSINISTFISKPQPQKPVNKSESAKEMLDKVEEITPAVSEKDKLIDKFNEKFKGKYPELDERLKDEVIQQANPNTQGESYVNYSIWVINTINKEYLENSQNDSNIFPRNSYLVTEKYWKQISGDALNVECAGGNPIAYNTLPVIITPLDDFQCDGSVYIYDLETGNNIPLSDPNNLIPNSKPGILTESGGTNGLVKDTYVVYQQGGKDDIWLVNLIYTSEEGLYASAFFNVETGELMGLLNF